MWNNMDFITTQFGAFKFQCTGIVFVEDDNYWSHADGPHSTFCTVASKTARVSLIVSYELVPMRQTAYGSKNILVPIASLYDNSRANIIADGNILLGDK